jgi:iron complex outermembrane receptor protein
MMRCASTDSSLAHAVLPLPPPKAHCMGMPATTTWTADMVRALPDDGKRYEVIDGELFVTPAPSWTHQRAVRELLLRLAGYLREDLATFRGRNSWRDETAWNYEVGGKSQMWGGRLSLNLAAFYMDIRDLQVTVTAGSCTSRLIFNVPKAVSRGAEIELVAAPNDRFDFSVSATLTRSELRSTLTSTDTAGNVSVVAGIREGNRLPSVPEVQGAASAGWRWPFRAGMQAFLAATYQYVGSRYTQIDDLAEEFGTLDMTQFEDEGGRTIGGPLTQTTFTFNPKLPAYQLLNVRVGLSRPSWDVALFVNNLTDERALLALDRERGARARVGYLTNQPRTLGLTMTFNY